MGWITSLVCWWSWIQKCRNRQCQCRLIRRISHLRLMQQLKNQSFLRLRSDQRQFIIKQKHLGLSWRDQKKRSLCLRNRHWSIYCIIKSRWWSLSNLRRDLGRRSFFPLIIQTYERYVEKCHQNQKSSLINRNNERLSLTRQQRFTRWWSHARKSQNYVDQLQRKSWSRLLRSCRCRISRNWSL